MFDWATCALRIERGSRDAIDRARGQQTRCEGSSARAAANENTRLASGVCRMDFVRWNYAEVSSEPVTMPFKMQNAKCKRRALGTLATVCLFEFCILNFALQV